MPRAAADTCAHAGRERGGGAVPDGASVAEGSYGILFNTTGTSKLFLTTSGTVVARERTFAARPYTGFPAEALPAPTLKGGRTGCGDVTVYYDGSFTPPTESGTYTVTFDVDGGQNCTGAVGLAYGTLTTGGTELWGSVSGKKLTYSVDDAPSNALLIVAWYGGNGRMLGTTSTGVSKGYTTDATLNVASGAESYKLMLLDKTSFTPLCASANAEKG